MLPRAGAGAHLPCLEAAALDALQDGALRAAAAAQQARSRAPPAHRGPAWHGRLSLSQSLSSACTSLLATAVHRASLDATAGYRTAAPSLR